MLTSFTIKHTAAGGTVCSLIVEPGKRWVSGTIMRDGTVTHAFTEIDLAIAAGAISDWHNIEEFEAAAMKIATRLD